MQGSCWLWSVHRRLFSKMENTALQGNNKPRNQADGLRVGVTILIRDNPQSLWENGIFQNCFFLVELLARSKIISKVMLVNGGPGDPLAAGDFLACAPAPVIGLTEAMQELDLIIELSCQLAPAWGQEFVAKGGRIVGMHVANDYIIDAERMVFGLDPGFRMEPVPYDEIWTLPAFEKTCSSYYRAALGVPVYVMPHLWSPKLLERAIEVTGNSQNFSYQPGRRSWRLAILEPNICTVKTCHLPLLLADVAYRMDPWLVAHLRVYSALKLKEHSDFVAYARSLDLVTHGRATFEGRFPVYDVLGRDCDAVISHHWENGQNYLYYEALYGGFPLIHNSRFLAGCGYKYHDFDPFDGALALREAFAGHDRNLETYRAKSNAFLETLNPADQTNIKAFETAIERVLHRDLAL